MHQPWVISFFSDVETPVSLFHKVSLGESMAFLLESTDGDNRLARFSFIGIAPKLSLSFREGNATLVNHLNQRAEEHPFTDPLALMEKIQQEELQKNPRYQGASKLPFTGGWVGYLGYGATHYFDGIPKQAHDPFHVPDGYYGFYDTVLIFDHLYRRVSFVCSRKPSEAKVMWEIVERRIKTGKTMTPLFYDDTLDDEKIFKRVTASMDEARFCDMVKVAQAKIEEGQVFQIVTAHRFSCPINIDPLNVYRTLQAINPSPYSYFLKFSDFYYLGSSPETFVSCQDGEVVLQALAGTSPRGETDEEDNCFAQALRDNEKEMAEHRMLVDLGRNDLGRVCETGSIEVGEIARITRYTHVMHLATRLSGQIKQGKTAYDVVRSCFPRGTVSGAPKIRAMQLLSELEPEQRGIYAGMVGYFDNRGNMDGAIAIRSALIKDGIAHINAGAGIVYDSVPEMEYQETRNKAKSTLKAIQIAVRIGSHDADSAD